MPQRTRQPVWCLPTIVLTWPKMCEAAVPSRHARNLLEDPQEIRPWCPCCKGAGVEIALWEYVEPESLTQWIASNTATNPLSSRVIRSISSDPGSRMSSPGRQGRDVYHDSRSRSATPVPKTRFTYTDVGTIGTGEENPLYRGNCHKQCSARQ